MTAVLSLSSARKRFAADARCATQRNQGGKSTIGTLCPHRRSKMDMVVEATDHRTGQWKRRVCMYNRPWNEGTTKTTRGTEMKTMEPRDKMEDGKDGLTRVGDSSNAMISNNR